MKINAKNFRVKEKQAINLKGFPTSIKPFYDSKEEYQNCLLRHIEKLNSLQNILYADDRYSLLIIFQAMDAAGKDSAIKHVMSGLNPQGCQVFDFKHPSSEELDHDFLWRTTRCLPERGRIGIFNRSYYEEVLIARVHPEILESQRLPDHSRNDKNIWKERFQSIVDLEKHLFRNGTRIIKFFLHLSKDEQRKRFLKRIDDPEKNWKFSMADIEERKRWDDYMKAYASCLSATSTSFAPWYVIPADDKPNSQLIISEAILDSLSDLKMSYPKPDAQRRKELSAIRKLLE